MKLGWRVTIGGLAVAAIMALGAYPFGLLEPPTSPPEATTFETIVFPVTDKIVNDPLDTPLLRRFFQKYGEEITRKSIASLEWETKNLDKSTDRNAVPELNRDECTTERALGIENQESEVSDEKNAPPEDIFLFHQGQDNQRPNVISWQEIVNDLPPEITPSEPFPHSVQTPRNSISVWFGGEVQNNLLFKTVATSIPLARFESAFRGEMNADIDDATTETSSGASVSELEGPATTSLPTARSAKKCGLNGIVTVQDGGRLGNKLWEYAAVWALGHALDLRPLVPLTLARYLKRYFKDLSVGTLEDATPPGCPKDPEAFGEPMKRWRLFPLETLKERLNITTGGNLVLHRWIILPEPVIALRGERLRKEFRFHQKFVDEAERTLQLAANEVNWRRRKENCTTTKVTFVGVHVRRTDFAQWLPRVYNKSLATATYFHRAMDHFRNKTKGPIAFMVTSDDPSWVKINLGARLIGSPLIRPTGKKDVFLGTREGDHTSNGIGHDFALLSLCNHSIIDYGTFGAWGALMAGGNTISLNSDRHLDKQLADSIPGWTIWDDPGIRQKS